MPPRTSRRSNTMGVNPASAKYLAHDSPANPAPAIATRIDSSLCLRVIKSLWLLYVTFRNIFFEVLR